MARPFRSTAYRLAFLYSVLFALAVLALGIGVFFAVHANFRREQDRTLQPEAARVLREYTEGGIPDLSRSIRKREARPNNNFSYAVITRDGRHLVGSTRLAQIGPGFHDITVSRRGGPLQPARVLGTSLGDGSVLYVIVDSEELDRLETQLLALFGGGFFLVVLMASAGALLLVGHLKRRLERIVITAQAIRDGNFGQRVATGSDDDEFDRVDRALNAMLDRIDELVTNLRQVSSDVAHDMRTPLYRLRGEIEAGLNAAADGATQRRALQNALERSDALLTLFSAILRIAEVEGQSSADFDNRIDLAALVSAACDMHLPAIEDGGRALRLILDRDVRVAGNRELLTQAISNLLDNAQSHTPVGTVITVAVEGDGDNACLIVADDGPGVAEDDRPRIARRFVRLHEGRPGPGHGLGLNLVATIARAHGGSLRIEDNAPGLRVTIVLPQLWTDRAVIETSQLL